MSIEYDYTQSLCSKNAALRVEELVSIMGWSEKGQGAILLNYDLVQWYMYSSPGGDELNHWGRVMHICVVRQTIIGSDNGLSPGRRQAIIWINAGILLIGPLGTNFSEILIGIQTFSFKKMRLKMLSAKWRPFCLGLNELNGLKLMR